MTCFTNMVFISLWRWTEWNFLVLDDEKCANLWLMHFFYCLFVSEFKTLKFHISLYDFYLLQFKQKVWSVQTIQGNDFKRTLEGIPRVENHHLKQGCACVFYGNHGGGRADICSAKQANHTFAYLCFLLLSQPPSTHRCGVGCGCSVIFCVCSLCKCAHPQITCYAHPNTPPPHLKSKKQN